MRLIGVRFSLRTLLLVIAVGPAAVYWVGLPTLNAHRYAAALEAGDYAAADRLCADGAHVFPGEMKDWLSFNAQARIEPWYWEDIWNGKRRLEVYHQAHVGSMVMSFKGFEAVATRKGIVFPPEEGRLGIEMPY